MTLLALRAHVLFGVIILCIPLFSHCGMGAQPGDYFDNSMPASPSNKTQSAPAIAVDKLGNAHIVWEDYREGNSDIYYACWNASSPYKHTSEGFSKAIKISDAGGSFSQQNPEIAVDGRGTIYAVWEDNRKGTDFDIYFAKSTDGKTFSPNKIVNDYTGNANQLDPDIVVDADGMIYIAYDDDRLGKTDVYVTRSMDGGTTFSPSVRVNNMTDGMQSYPSLAVNQSGAVFVAWQDSRNSTWDVYLACSDTMCASFYNEVRVNDLSDGNQMHPSLTVAGGAPFVAWTDDRDGEQDLYGASASFVNGSIVPGANVPICCENSSEQTSPTVQSDGNEGIYIMWHNNVPGSSSIMLARSFGGNTFENATKVGDTMQAKSEACFAIEPRLGLKCVAWVESNAVFFTYSGKVDFVIDASSVILSPAHPNDKERTRVYVKISNTGSVGAGGVELSFLDFFNETGANSSVVSKKTMVASYIKPKGYVKLQFNDTFKKGHHIFSFYVDPQDKYYELDENNNQVSVEVEVEEGGIITTDLVMLIVAAIFAFVAIALAAYFTTRQHD